MKNKTILIASIIIFFVTFLTYHFFIKEKIEKQHRFSLKEEKKTVKKDTFRLLTNQQNRLENTAILEVAVNKNHFVKKEISLSEAQISDDEISCIIGKCNFRKNGSFIKMQAIHSSKTIFLNKEVYKSFIKMYDKAKADGIILKVISGTRNFYQQKYIWERKCEKHRILTSIERAKKILEYSSMPSTSRHHWGTDIDLNNLNNAYFEKGKGKKEYDWLVSNANDFGFYQVYTSKANGRTGYNMEKWHWSYLPLASKYLAYYNENITYTDIKGFKGAALAEEMKMISDYVNGISQKAKNFE